MLLVVANSDTAAELLNLDLEKIMTSFNRRKTESLLIALKLNKPVHPPLFMDNQVTKDKESPKHLGVFLSNH